MAIITTRVPKFYRNLLLTIFSLSWLSGILFFTLHNFFMVEGEFGIVKHPWQQPVLMIHGAAAFFILMAFGAMLVSHVPSSWKLNRLRKLGITMITLIAIQIISAYGLYYLSNEDLRNTIADVHFYNGLIIPFVLLSHIFMGYNTRPRLN